ncbi:hypothetical protein PHMEG_00014717 [Phytophthora megakarya]|uniref:Uncharacterized protein n=1 Tax=Phytophthora megakarya TaxID=4795 RepID=A0A225W3M8_9STRA|nr:hypothetical protein PHMEG_00014717 [Phytophthora megakarya]
MYLFHYYLPRSVSPLTHWEVKPSHTDTNPPTPDTSGTRQRRRPAPSARDVQATAGLASHRAVIWERIRLHGICTTFGDVGLLLPDITAAPALSPPSLNKPFQQVLSEYIRRTQLSLQRFIELLRSQSTDNYRPIKHATQWHPCRSQHYQRPNGSTTNHKSAADRYTVPIWPEVHISPFGVVDKGDADQQTTGRTIHDLSFPTGRSINDFTGTDNICTPTFEKSDTVAREILLQKAEHPGVDVKLQAGDVACAFRNKDNALVFNTAVALGWSGSPATYGVIGGTIAYIHGSSVNRHHLRGLINYNWVDDHINVASDIGHDYSDARNVPPQCHGYRSWS